MLATPSSPTSSDLPPLLSPRVSSNQQRPHHKATVETLCLLALPGQLQPPPALPQDPHVPQQRGLCWAHLAHLAPSGSNRASRSQSAFCGRTPSIHRVLSWPGGLRAPGPSLTLTLPQGPPPPLGFRGLEGPSTGRKAGLARARPWGQMQAPPQPRPLHAGSSGIQPPACPPSCALRPQGTAAVCVVRTPASAALRRGPPGPSPALNAHPNLSLCREGR